MKALILRLKVDIFGILNCKIIIKFKEKMLKNGRISSFFLKQKGVSYEAILSLFYFAAKKIVFF